MFFYELAIISVHKLIDLEIIILWLCIEMNDPRSEY